jgi:predicted transcriptional regulator
MAMNLPDVTETELAVLEQLWAAGDDEPATIRSISDRLYPGGGAAHYATVQKLLERLEAKKFVRRDDSAMAHRFTPAVGREELIGRRLRAVADKLCGGSMTPLITSLVESRALTKRELSELRELIERLDGESSAVRKPPRKRGV